MCEKRVNACIFLHLECLNIIQFWNFLWLIIFDPMFRKFWTERGGSWTTCFRFETIARCILSHGKWNYQKLGRYGTIMESHIWWRNGYFIEYFYKDCIILLTTGNFSASNNHSKGILNIDPRNSKILLTEAPMNPKKNREKLIETMFEKYGVQGMIQILFIMYFLSSTLS